LAGGFQCRFTKTRKSRSACDLCRLAKVKCNVVGEPPIRETKRKSDAEPEGSRKRKAVGEPEEPRPKKPKTASKAALATTAKKAGLAPKKDAPPRQEPEPDKSSSSDWSSGDDTSEPDDEPRESPLDSDAEYISRAAGKSFPEFRS
jgi:hypothetical protein